MGPPRRKPAFEDFAERRTLLRFRALMIADNKAAVPAGFERTLATRETPRLTGEVAASQSLKDARRRLQAAPQLERQARRKGFFKGDVE